MAKTGKKSKKTFEWRDLFAGPRKWFVIAPAILLLMGVCWWSYQQVTTIPPAEVAKGASIEEVREFISSERGIGRLSAPECEQYLARTWQYYAQAPPEQRRLAIQAVERMSPAQKQVLGNAVARVMKHRVMEAAKTYNGLSSAGQKTAFARKFMGDLRQVQSKMIGGAGPEGPGLNLGPALQEVTPTKPADIQKAVLNNTSSGERAKAEPLIEKLADVHREEINQKLQGG